VHTFYNVDVEWDKRKAEANLGKHGVDFAEAVTALHDDLAVTIPDDHPHEDRFITVGRDAEGRLLVVVYAWRNAAIRIISARRATRRERSQYESGK
jgi:uncharacterized DUF497 family protein